MRKTRIRSTTVNQPKLQPPPPCAKPMARVVRVPLFVEEVRERLSNAALEILFAHANVLAEGRRADSPTARRAFFGSVMITIDLASAAGELRDACSPEAAARVAVLLQEDARACKRLRQLAEQEASRLAGAAIRVHSADLRVRAAESRVLVDVDFEE
jgi:hypothetical protein